VGTHILFVSSQIANPQIRKFPDCQSPQIANPQICKEKSSVFDPDLYWFASDIIFYLRKYFVDYERPCNPKNKKEVFKFE
jgi:hypothetical protein